ncbi:MATE efflux family protein [Haematococcus lacustris]
MKSVCNHNRRLGQLALPLLLQYIIANASTLINTSYVGHEADPVELSGLVLATSLSMATGYNIISGITSASATLCGQAFGSSNYSALHNTLQRSLLICALACVPITGVWMHAEWILQHLGQTPAIAAGASRYLQLTLPALYLYTIHECVDKYLLSQGVVRPALAITAASTALTPVFAWWFVAHQGLGLEGAAWAYVAVQACTTGLGLAYLGYRELVKLPGSPPPGFQPLRPSRSALQGWGPYVALAVPAVLSYCMEGWAVEVLIFLSGACLLDNAEVAVGVTGLALQFSTLVWLAAASLGSATSTRVAIELGRGDGLAAKRTAQTAVGAVLVTQTLIGLAAYSCARPLLGLMTNNTEVMQLSLTVMPVLACCFIADGLNAVQGAVLRGAGRQWWTAGLAIVGWWCVGVPLAYWLGLVQGGNVPGLWAGFAVASALQSGLQAVAINK